ncbi:hypothetical protein DJ568_16270 [Mucilaginibacter hurinus]|uniref:DUF3997 domain-containing protein n=1 Tax=Mucilaginibacter hurinus TaxID=2201324 RepID=A0A367GM78_9SPHI|nr:hypothetical protein [Mucilaginibacter hurinus]RCH53791.1 hypothetical protein DJ568_16270 [Mucilaginibacter hurinus]
MRPNALTLICVIISIMLGGCKTQIDEHLYIENFDNGKELVYVDVDDYMFSVIDADVKAYAKCSKFLFVIQEDANGRLQYYIIDRSLDYSDEKLKPTPFLKSYFYSFLNDECTNVELAEF